MPAAGGRTDQGYLNRLPTDLLPKELVGPVFDKAQEQSLVLRAGARQIPVGYGETVISTTTQRPEVGQVGGTTTASREGAEKPLSGVGWGSQSFSPIKLATIVTVSEEFANANVDGLYAQITDDLGFAIGRGIDLAVLHNKRPDTGAALVGTAINKSVNATTKRVELDPAGNVADQLIAGYSTVVADGFDFTGFAADPRFRPTLLTARDSNGSPVFQATPNLRDQVDSILGLPVRYGRGVSGQLGAATDTGARAFAGDWSQLVYGYADQVTIRTDRSATVGGVSMFQTNQIALLIEVTFGWLVNDVDAFVAYDLPAVTP